MSLASVQAAKSQDRTLDAAEIGTRYLYKTEGTVWADLSRAPARLPPPIHIPGARKTLWLESTVVAWLEECQVPAKTAAPKRGRPSKRMQVEKQRSAHNNASAPESAA